MRPVDKFQGPSSQALEQFGLAGPGFCPRHDRSWVPAVGRRHPLRTEPHGGVRPVGPASQDRSHQISLDPRWELRGRKRHAESDKTYTRHLRAHLNGRGPAEPRLWAVLRWAVLRWAVLRWAVLRWAVLRWAFRCSGQVLRCGMPAARIHARRPGR